MHNADILTDIDLAGLYRHHLESDAESTLLVSERKTSRYLLFDDDYHLHGWINKSTGEVKPAGFDYRETKYRELAFGGIHIISPSLFHLMDDGQWTASSPSFLSTCPPAQRCIYKAIRCKDSAGSTSANRRHWHKRRNTTNKNNK